MDTCIGTTIKKLICPRVRRISLHTIRSFKKKNDETVHSHYPTCWKAHGPFCATTVGIQACTVSIVLVTSLYWYHYHFITSQFSLYKADSVCGKATPLLQIRIGRCVFTPSTEFRVAGHLSPAAFPPASTLRGDHLQPCPNKGPSTPTWSP